MNFTWPLTLLLAGTCSLPAVELTDLAGDWFITDICSPSALREVYQEIDPPFSTRTSVNSCDFAGLNEFLTDAFYTEPFDTVTRSMSLSSSGAVTGDETGQVLSISQNRLLYSDGTDPITVYSNTIGDVLLASSATSDLLEQSVLLKKPPSMTTAELQGAWFIVSMINPIDLSKTIDSNGVSDVWFNADSSMISGDINITNVGTFSGLFSGTITATAPGEATVNAGGPVFFKSNASKNLAIATLGDASEREYLVLVRKPATVTTAELAGTWRVSAMQIPTKLIETWYNTVTTGIRDDDSDGTPLANEDLIDLEHPAKFDFTRLQLQVATDGTLPNGSFVANNGNKTVTFNYDGDTIIMHPNADKTFMVGTVVEAESHELIVFIKTSHTSPTTFEETTDLQTITSGNELLLNWNSANNLILQESTTLGGWTTVQNANGSDTFTADLSSGGRRFFRVSEAP